MPEAKCLESLEERGGVRTVSVHQIGSPWIRTLAPFRNILAGEEVCFLDGAGNRYRGALWERFSRV